MPIVHAWRRRIPPRAAVLCGLWLLAAAPLHGAGNEYQDYDALAAGLYWAQLYGDGGWTLYCGEQFTPDRRTASGKSIGIEHIFTVSAMLDVLGCRTRFECRSRSDGKFARMEADMHNLYPEWLGLTIYRNGRSYGVVDGEEWRFDDCDVEWGSGYFEPRPIARGNVARALLYMHDTYGVKFDAATVQMLRAWHEEDPPSRQEYLRNDAIQKLQGRRNAWIDRETRRPRQNVASD